MQADDGNMCKGNRNVTERQVEDTRVRNRRLKGCKGIEEIMVTRKTTEEAERTSLPAPRWQDKRGQTMDELVGDHLRA